MLRAADPSSARLAARMGRAATPTETSDATPMSRPKPRGAAISAVAMALAWSSLVASSVIAASGCLVTPTPDFQPARQTPAYLVAADAKPDLRQPVIVTDLNEQAALTFSASVVSQDQGPVYTELLIDYGFDNVANQKARYVLPGKSIPAGSIDDAPRSVSVNWYPSINPVGGGCHTVTLMVSHGFDEDGTGCPQRLCDASFLVWQVMLPCAAGDTCPTTCPPPTDTCPAELDHGVDSKITCPGDDQDAGVSP